MLNTASLRNRMFPALAALLGRPESGDADTILILQPDHLGDIILSEPAVRMIRGRLPGAKLIGVLGAWSTAIGRLAWPVDDIVDVRFPGFDRSEVRNSPVAPYAQLRRDAARLRTLYASRAVILRDDAWWATALARAAVSRSVVSSNDPRNRPFATGTVSLTDSIHNTDRAVMIAAGLLGLDREELDASRFDMSPRVDVSDESRSAATALLSKHRVSEPYIVFHPGAGAAVKTWPARSWQAVLRSLSDFRVIITGGADEAVECAEIASSFSHVTSLAGKTSLEELLGLFASCRLAIGSDNGPLHLAAAAGASTIRLFGPSNPRRYGPYPGNPQHRTISSDWSCPRCEDLSAGRARVCGCMLAITPKLVVEAIQEALGNAA